MRYSSENILVFSWGVSFQHLTKCAEVLSKCKIDYLC